jgi:hypothetical protein
MVRCASLASWAPRPAFCRSKSLKKSNPFSVAALMIFRIGSGARPRETRAFHVMATLEGGMMLARAYRSIEAFDQAAASLTT